MCSRPWLYPPYQSSLFLFAWLLFTGPLCVWLGKKHCANISSWIDLSMPWNMYFSFAIWSLWLHRNKVVFRNSPLNRELNRELWAVASEFMYWASPTRLVKRKQVIKVRWNKPKIGLVKLNMVGCSLGNPSLDSGGALFETTMGLG